MKESHNFSFETSSSAQDLLAFIQTHFSLPAEEAMEVRAAFELKLHEFMMKFSREVHEADFERMDVSVDGLVVDGKRYRRKGVSKGEYMTIAEKIEVNRTTYEERGGHGGRTLVPLEMRLGLIDNHWTPPAAEVGCAYMVAAPSKEAAKLLSLSGNMTPSPSHLDRLPKTIGTVWQENRKELEDAVRAAEKLPPSEEVATVAISLDGVMMPVRLGEEYKPKPSKKKIKDDESVAYKEAACGTVSLYDPKGIRLHTIRFAQMPESKKVTLQQILTDETAKMRLHYPEATFMAIADGALENWRIFTEIENGLGIQFERVLDFYHAMEHVVNGLKRYAEDDAAPTIEYFRAVLRDEPKGIKTVQKAIEYRVNRSKGKKRKEIKKVLKYLINHKDMMDYHRLQASNLPIGSGVQEAACKTLVSQRMKQSGMSWTQAGGQSILTLRGQDQSNRWKVAWHLISRKYVKEYKTDENRGRLRPSDKKMAA